MTSSGKKDYKEKHGMVICYVGYMWASDSIYFLVKFRYSEKATKFDKIFAIDLTLCIKCQIDGEDFVNFCGILRKHELYTKWIAKIDNSNHSRCLAGYFHS